MTTATELFEYAKECMRWADSAPTDDEREACIALARGWTEAALVLEGAIKPAVPQQRAKSPNPSRVGYDLFDEFLLDLREPDRPIGVSVA